MQEIILRKDAIRLGLKRYFTGKECPKGHVAERLLSNGTCLVCIKQKSAAYAKTDKGKLSISIRQKKYLAEFGEKVRATKKKYADKNKEKLREKNRILMQQKRMENPELLLQITRNWRANNKDKVLEYARKYRATKNGSNILASHKAKRKAVKLKATPIWADKSRIYKFYLDKPIGMQVDHIVPLVSKVVCGLHCEANLQYLTPSENIAKRNYWWPDMW